MLVVIVVISSFWFSQLVKTSAFSSISGILESGRGLFENRVLALKQLNTHHYIQNTFFCANILRTINKEGFFSAAAAKFNLDVGSRLMKRKAAFQKEIKVNVLTNLSIMVDLVH